MAKSRKPAITGMARPSGIIDDIILPIADKALKTARYSKNTKLIKKIDKLENKKKPLKPKQSKTLDKTYSKQDRLSRRSEDGLGVGNERRRQAYEKTSEKNTLKSEIAVKKGKFKAEDRFDRRERVAWSKMQAMEKGTSPRRAAVSQRKQERKIVKEVKQENKTTRSRTKKK
jgi:hypothetical protein